MQLQRLHPGQLRPLTFDMTISFDTGVKIGDHVYWGHEINIGNGITADDTSLKFNFFIVDEFANNVVDESSNFLVSELQC